MVTSWACNTCINYCSHASWAAAGNNKNGKYITLKNARKYVKHKKDNEIAKGYIQKGKTSERAMLNRAAVYKIL